MVPKRLYKFGMTSFPDVLDRYSVERHYQEGWRARPLAEDYDVRVLWSRWATFQEAQEAESWFKINYPKNFSSTITYNGITECRRWSPDQSYAFTEVLNKKFPKKDFDEERNFKIYFVMLTLKQA